MKTTVLTLALGFALAAPVSAASLSDVFSGYYVFGDSLSDDGNLFERTSLLSPDGSGRPPAPYFDGRFTNGLVFSELLAADFDSANTENYAFGGATALGGTGGMIDNLTTQLGNFLTDSALTDTGERPLVSIWVGANDILQSVASADLFSTSIAAAMAVGDAIETLANDGASSITDFVVFTLPDIGMSAQFAELNFNNADLTPGDDATDFAVASQLQAAATAAVQLYNHTLIDELGLLSATGLNIYTVDAFALLTEAQADPDSFGLINSTSPCLYVDPAETPDGVFPYCGPDLAKQYLFFDGVHPSSTIHARLADEVRAAIVPLPGGLPLLGGAMLGLGFVMSRRRDARAT
ncbi:MAG: SGNH/GDSL hydrolase family protein [Alphaproteobacteria bacterium]|nr:SGNH/GDSL hydrolase family protein [Alphaproteobacteria bacterium]